MRPISNIETEKDQDSALVAIQALMSEQDRASSESLRMPNGAVAQGDSGLDIVEPASVTTGRTIADRLMQIGRTASAHPRFLAICMLTLLVLWKPVVLLMAFVPVVLPIIALFIYLSFVGIDGFWLRARDIYLGTKARNPALAERMKKGFMLGAAKWDSLMDRLPVSVPETAYAPDFGAIAAAEAAHDAALAERFAKLQNEEQA